jgi:hypothetical protein
MSAESQGGPTVVKSFILGAITGATIIWFWGQEIRDFLDAQTAGIREAAAQKLQTAADGFQAAADGLQSAKHTIESGLGGA